MVRVSRRVGWDADRLATDPGRCCERRQRRSADASTQAARAARRRCERRGDAAGSGPARERESADGRVFLDRATTRPSRACKLRSARKRAPRSPCSRGLRPPPERSWRTVARGVRRRTRDVAPAGELRREQPGTTDAVARLSAPAEPRGQTLRFHPFTSKRFHVLFNSLFRVLLQLSLKVLVCYRSRAGI